MAVSNQHIYASNLIFKFVLFCLGHNLNRQIWCFMLIWMQSHSVKEREDIQNITRQFYANTLFLKQIWFMHANLKMRWKPVSQWLRSLIPLTGITDVAAQLIVTWNGLRGIAGPVTPAAKHPPTLLTTKNMELLSFAYEWFTNPNI